MTDFPSDRLIIGSNGQIYLAQPNDPSIEDDWGFYVMITPEELLRAARRFLSDDLIIDALEVQINQRTTPIGSFWN